MKSFTLSSFSCITTFTLGVLMTSVNAQLTVTEPSSSHWWVANSDNTLAWTGTNPTEFSVFLSNPNTAMLTSDLALESITETYIYSQTINPGIQTPGDGYFLKLTDPLNSTNVYATSPSFEIKAQGSAYPPQTTSSNSTTQTQTGSSSYSPSASATVSAQKISNGVQTYLTFTYGGSITLGVVAFDALLELWEDLKPWNTHGGYAQF